MSENKAMLSSTGETYGRYELRRVTGTGPKAGETCLTAVPRAGSRRSPPRLHVVCTVSDSVSPATFQRR